MKTVTSIGAGMARCRICGRSKAVSSVIGYCRDCLIKHWERVKSSVLEAHREVRRLLQLTPGTPVHPDGLKCRFCGRGCVIPEDSRGYCSFIVNRRGAPGNILGSFELALGDWYYDPHPTNCVAFPVCPAITGEGYPRYALSPLGEHGYYNIAVFYGSCNLNCLYCQNHVFKKYAAAKYPFMSVEDLAGAVNSKTTCACFFGGDPAPNAVHALMAARRMISRAREIGLQVFRVCWETNGLWERSLLREALKISLESGGIVKFDVKAYTPQVYTALTGVDEKHVKIVYGNLEYALREFSRLRSSPPPIVVSVLLVPGYVKVEEVEGIAGFIAGLNPETPLVLLAFHPDFYMSDLPATSRKHMDQAVKAARGRGLRNVYIGNEWLLTDSDYPF